MDICLSCVNISTVALDIQPVIAKYKWKTDERSANEATSEKIQEDISKDEDHLHNYILIITDDKTR